MSRSIAWGTCLAVGERLTQWCLEAQRRPDPLMLLHHDVRPQARERAVEEHVGSEREVPTSDTRCLVERRNLGQ